MKQLIFLILFLFIVVACDKKDDQPFDITTTRLNIADAKMLALCGSAKTRSSDNIAGFMKINKSGESYDVDWVDPTSGLKMAPGFILPLNDEYLMMGNLYRYDATGKLEPGYYSLIFLVRKSDGVVFKIDTNKYPELYSDDIERIHHENRVLPLSDNRGNVYILINNRSDMSGYAVCKFSLKDPSNLTFQKITLEQFPLDVYGTHMFEVDKDGNCITRVSSYELGKKILLYKSEGGMYEFPNELNIFDYFKGSDGRLYCCGYILSNYDDYQYKIFPVNMGTQVAYDFENAVSKATQTNYVYGSGLTTLENKYIHILFSSKVNNMLIFNSKTNEIKEVGFPSGKMENVVGVSNNSVFRIMNNKIYQYDCIADEKTILPIDFDFSKYTIYKDWIAYNSVQGSKFVLGTIRNSDMAIVRIEVDMESGHTKIYEDAQDRPIISLVQID